MKGYGYRAVLASLAALLGVALTGDIVKDSIIVGVAIAGVTIDFFRSRKKLKEEKKEQPEEQPPEEPSEDSKEDDVKKEEEVEQNGQEQ